MITTGDLVKWYLEDKLSFAQMKKRCGHTSRWIYLRLARAGVDTRRVAVVPVRHADIESDPLTAKVRELHALGYRVLEIGAIVGKSPAYVLRRLGSPVSHTGDPMNVAEELVRDLQDVADAPVIEEPDDEPDVRIAPMDIGALYDGRRYDDVTVREGSVANAWRAAQVFLQKGRMAVV